MVLQIVLLDIPLLWGVLRMSEPAQNNVEGSPVFDQKSWCVGGTPEVKRPHALEIIMWNEIISNQKARWRKAEA